MSRVAVVLLLALLICAASARPASGDPEPLLQQALSLHQSGDFDGAIHAYQSYLAQRPASLIALSNLGAAYAHNGRYEDAVEQYKRALKIEPGNVQVKLNLALAYYKASHLNQAAPLFASVHAALPGELQPVLLLADCWLSLGKNKEVADLLSPIAETRPDDLGIAYLLGTALVRDKQTARGQIVIDRILRNGDSAEASLLMGTTNLQVHDYPAALADLSKAVKLNPKLPDVYSFYGKALVATGDEEGAKAAFKTELESNPNDFNSALQLGAILKRDDQMDEASKYLARALQVRPGDLAVRYQLAAIEFSRGNIEKAEKELEGIIKESPTFTEAHVLLATAYYRSKRKDEADRERAIVRKLTAETQAKQPGVTAK
jgi:tetratricopeptide (TPR) repeat protein